MSTNVTEIKYEKRLVLFIDILGFSDLVMKSQADIKELQKIKNVLKRIEEKLIEQKYFENIHEEHQRKIRSVYSLTDEVYINPSKIEYTQFSDSIIISMSYVSAQSLVSLISTVSLLQAEFLSQGVLFRGGITYGDIFHSENLCFGPAFIKAFHLEDKKAVFPRVLIDTDIITGKTVPSNWEEHDEIMFQSLIKPWLYNEQSYTSNPIAIKDSKDEHYFVNFMLLGTFRNARVEILKIFNDQKDILDQTDKQQEKVYLKLVWLIDTIEKYSKIYNDFQKR